MKKVIILIISYLGMLISAQAQAQVIQAGQTYYGGATLELAGSEATFVVPRGWNGRYNQREKLFEMSGPAGENLSVGYEGKSYADALAYAKKPITTSDGIVMTPFDLQKIQNDRTSGEMVIYKGTALFIPVGAVGIVLKTPANKGLTLSSVGLGNNFEALINQIALVGPTLHFPVYEQELKAKEVARLAEIERSRKKANQYNSRVAKGSNNSGSSESFSRGSDGTQSYFGTASDGCSYFSAGGMSMSTCD
ncbi:hypothetical protein JYT23_00480 [Mariprofundus ferrooxydans]|nr:hypothetical protein [Mariprofundus ferrooxydans]